MAGSLDIEEQLSYLNCSVKRCEDWLGRITDVDLMGGSGRTLLHISVRLGMVDWVEKLLSMGADPMLKDESNLNALQIAQELSTKHPENTDHKNIFRLVNLVISRENSGHRLMTECDDHLMGQHSSDTETFLSLLSQLSHEIASFRESGSKELGEVRSKLDDLTEQMSKLSSEVATVNGNVQQGLSGIQQELASVKMETLRSQREECEGNLNMNMGEWKSECSANEVRLNNMKAAEEFCVECVDLMMKRTVILNGNEDQVSQIRHFYERLLSMGRQMSHIVLFLRSKTEVEVWIDCDRYHVGKMKMRLRNHDGIEDDGSKYSMHVDFNEGRVYLGGIILNKYDNSKFFTNLALCLAEMSIFYTFRNKGMPYTEDDLNSRLQLQKIVKEVESRKKTGTPWDFDGFINGAMTWNTEAAKEIVLTASVPAMIVKYGLLDATSRLRRQLPSLLEYYSNHVVDKLFYLLKGSICCEHGWNIKR